MGIAACWGACWMRIQQHIPTRLSSAHDRRLRARHSSVVLPSLDPTRRPCPAQARGCPLIGIAATPDLEAHKRRFLDNGWSRADARDMLSVYRHHIDPADRRRRGSAVATASAVQRAGMTACDCS